MCILHYIYVFQSIKIILAITLPISVTYVYVSSLDQVAEERKYVFLFSISVGRRLNSVSNFAMSSFFYMFFIVWFNELLI